MTIREALANRAMVALREAVGAFPSAFNHGDEVPGAELVEWFAQWRKDAVEIVDRENHRVWAENELDNYTPAEVLRCALSNLLKQIDSCGEIDVGPASALLDLLRERRAVPHTGASS